MKGFVLLIMLVAVYTEGYCWGFYAHKLVNRHAVYLLPPEMMAFFKPHMLYIETHAVDPDKRRYAVAEEGPRHYIDVDHYDRGVFSSCKMNWKTACDKFGVDSLKAHGIVPWWIESMLERLTAAFRERNAGRILKLSAEIGHYISDAHVPLHASSNHNGQFTGQQGIHGFWESRLPELFAEKSWDLWIGQASYIRKPLEFSWRTILASSQAADTVLLFEKQLHNRFPAEGKYAFEPRNGVLVKQYSTAYSKEYEKMLNGMVEKRLRESISAVASFWYTAWINAGQPDCRTLAGQEIHEEDNAEMEELNRKWREGRVLGKWCDGG